MNFSINSFAANSKNSNNFSNKIVAAVKGASSGGKSLRNNNTRGRSKRFQSVEYSILRGDQQTSESLEISISSSEESSEEDLFLGSGRSEFPMKAKGVYAMKQDVETYSQEDLIYSKRRIRNLRIILGIVFGLIAAALITVAVILLVNSDDADSPTVTKGGIQLDDVLSGRLSAQRFNGSWSTDSNIIYKDDLKIWEYNAATNKRSLLVDEADIKVRHAILYEKSADGKYLLIARDHFKIFRHSFEAIYDVIDLETGVIHPVDIKGQQHRLLLVKWAPVGNGLIVNFERNLYYKPSALEEEIQLTSDESPAVVNGIPDWVYEEEVFSSNAAVWFNPSGSKLAYIRFDDTPTRIINFPYYGEGGDLRYQYPLNRPVAYPKAGSPNPFVKLFHVDLKRAIEKRGNLEVKDYLTEILVPSALNTDAHIITSVQWLNDDQIFSVWMNRIQNRAHLQVSDDLKRYEIYNIHSRTGWVDLFTEPFVNRDGSQIALLFPQNQGTDGDFRHLTLISTKDSVSSNKPVALTSGKYVVQSILHWSTDTNLIFYLANTPEKSHVAHVYAIKAVAGEKPQCLTCGITSHGVEQTYFSADFNTKRHAVISSLGPGIPTHAVYQWSYENNKVSMKKIADWETNERLSRGIADKLLPETEIHTIPIANGFTAKVLLQLPAGLDRSGSKKYPMLVEVYGGPDSNSVTDKFAIDWGTYLTSNRSVIYAKIDGRGSGLRGDKLMHAIYLKLGTLEITDQIEVTKSLIKKLPYIDGEHTGIWGWSYGGYASAMALANDNSGAFKCAASIAPVTDWAYYDSIYTERYMGLPEENTKGYDDSRLTSLARKFEGKKFLLVHGTLDDNVHYQQSMILAKNLERNDIMFKQISYPDEDHGLSSVRPHLYHSLDRFFGQCFGLENDRWFRK